MNDGKGMSIAALVLGILSAIFAWWGLYIGIVSLVCGIVGIVLAVKGKKAAAAAGALGSGALDDLQNALDQIS